MISRALLNAPFFIPKDADLLRNRKVNTKKRQNRHLPELAFLILGTYFTAPFLSCALRRAPRGYKRRIDDVIPMNAENAWIWQVETNVNLKKVDVL